MVPARFVARQVYVPESFSPRPGIVSRELVERGRPSWSQDIAGLGLPKASHGRFSDSPGIFFIKF